MRLRIRMKNQLALARCFKEIRKMKKETQNGLALSRPIFLDGASSSKLGNVLLQNYPL